MKRTFHERTKAFFISMGRKNRVLRIPAIVGLALSMLFHHVYEYFRRGSKRFACAVFILLCFIVGNSFAFPVFQEENGFVSGEGKEREVAAVADSDIALVDARQVSYDEIEILDDVDVMDGYESAELHGMDQADKYLLDEILHQEIPGDRSNQDNAYEDGTEKFKEQDTKFTEDDWKLVLINKQHPIPDDYTFTLGPIKTIKGEMQCDERIIEDLLNMMQTAYENDGIVLGICSPYRDLNWQKVLFNRKIKLYMAKGMSYMDAYALSSQTVTVPGASEHQIGLAVDMVSDTYQDLDAGFADTDAGIWLKEHCSEYGFILRYPKGKEHITGIEWEPWHFRYVGKEAARIIMDEDLCLEEFWEKYL